MTGPGAVFAVIVEKARMAMEQKQRTGVLSLGIVEEIAELWEEMLHRMPEHVKRRAIATLGDPGMPPVRYTDVPKILRQHRPEAEKILASLAGVV
ncbi:MAG: hypothetical protein J7L14_03775 [Candidatus Diapherotrites archaeon]|nr:hypothetical protein [Candidatus Diapherotrites archaeon]